MSENGGGGVVFEVRTVASSARDINLSLSEMIMSYFGRLSLHSLGLICGPGTARPPTSAECRDTDIYGPGVTRPGDTVDFKHMQAGQRGSLKKNKLGETAEGWVLGSSTVVSFYTFGPKRSV